MDTLTHCITGAIIAKTGFSQRLGRIATISSVAASFMPDADILLRLFGNEDISFFVRYHRGPGNSLIFTIPLVLAISLIFNRISKKKDFGRFFVLSLIAILAHNLMDLQTSYGTMFFFPFSDKRFTLDLIFILDFFYSGILVLGLLCTIFWKGRAAWIARTTLLLIVLYTGLCAINHSRALSAAREFARVNNLEAIEVASLPQPLSPFLWANFVETDEIVYQGFLDLWGNDHHGYPDAPIEERKGAKTAPVTWSESISSIIEHVRRYKPRFRGIDDITYKPYVRFPDSPFVKKALNSEGVKLFLWFARFPIVLSEEAKGSLHIIRLFDLRFYSLEGHYPFIYEIQFDHEGNVKSQHFKGT